MVKIIIDKRYVIGEISRHLWGSFVEHMGRSIYGGVYEKDHSTADEQGFRGDVLTLTKNSGVTFVRYPGGNFVSGYDWKDGIGEYRPVRLDMAWGQKEPNVIGLNEFMSWAKKANVEVAMTVNMGTGTPKDAGELVEYCNVKGDTAWSDLRKKHGACEPYAIKKWFLGNEPDGNYQICALNAEDYGKKACETAKIMKWIDPSIELIVGASSSPNRATYPNYDRVALEHTYRHVDYVSMHRYYTFRQDSDLFGFLSSHTDMENYIRTMSAVVDYAKAQARSKKTIGLSLDEWNVWHAKPYDEQCEMNNGSPDDKWTVGPHRLENVYDYTDALVVGGIIMSVLNRADRVRIGCLSQLINVIGMILTDNGGKAIAQSIYFPLQMASKFAVGTAVQCVFDSPVSDSIYGSSPHLHHSVCYTDGSYRVFLENKTAEPIELELSFDASVTPCETHTLSANGMRAKNTMINPDAVRVISKKLQGKKDFKQMLTVPPYSFSVYIFTE